MKQRGTNKQQQPTTLIFNEEITPHDNECHKRNRSHNTKTDNNKNRHNQTGKLWTSLINHHRVP